MKPTRTKPEDMGKPYVRGPVVATLELSEDELAVMEAFIMLSAKADPITLTMAKLTIISAPKEAIDGFFKQLTTNVEAATVRMKAEDQLKSVEGEKNVS